MRSALALAALAFAACGANTTAAPVPARGQQNPLVGQPLGSLAELRWITADGKAPDLAARPLTLLRWWMIDCPFCRASLPDLTALQQRFAPRLQWIAVFHPKGGGPFPDAGLLEYLHALGVTAPLARDDEWKVLSPLLDRGKLTAATSISVLVDSKGIIRWVHPGPRLHRGRGAEFAAADADFRELEQVVAQLLR
jgi:hypothetical protein